MGEDTTALATRKEQRLAWVKRHPVAFTAGGSGVAIATIILALSRFVGSVPAEVLVALAGVLGTLGNALVQALVQRRNVAAEYEARAEYEVGAQDRREAEEKRQRVRHRQANYLSNGRHVLHHLRELQDTSQIYNTSATLLDFQRFVRATTKEVEARITGWPPELKAEARSLLSRIADIHSSGDRFSAYGRIEEALDDLDRSMCAEFRDD